MSKDTDYSLVLRRNEDVAAALLLYLHVDNNKDSEKHGIFTNIDFEDVVPSIKITTFISAW